MSKKNRKKQTHRSAASKSAAAKSAAAKSAAAKSAGVAAAKPFNPMQYWKAALAILVLASISVVGLAAYKQNYENTHDLSVIGNGVPTVVQVHDPSCPQCRRLKANTADALKKVKGDIQYRIADLTTGKGASLARRHHAGKVTLLTFDANGKFLNDYEGVMEPETITRLLESVATPPKS